jgi:protein-disulfide isomerase
MWNFADAFYRDQGPENSGYVSDDFLTEVAQAARVQPDPVVRAANGNAFERQLKATAAAAQAAGVNSTPSFLVARRGRAPRSVQLQQLTTEAFEQALQPELGQ